MNKDIIFLILKELQDDRKSLYSCLLANKIWCETTVPFLWKLAGRYKPTKNAMEILFNVILSHLSEESKNILKVQVIDLFIKVYKRPSFNYIYYWRYLNLYLLEFMIHSKKVEEFKITIMRNEILKLFINKNTKFIGLYIPQNFSYPIHLIFGAEYCLSTIEYLSCDANTNQSILKGLSKICKSIKKLRFDIIQDFKMVELIKAQKNLNDIYMSCYSYLRDELYCNNLEESLIKNSDTIQYLRIDWTPITQTLSLLTHMINPDPSAHLGAPIFSLLRERQVSFKILKSLIENTKGNLTEISIYYYDKNDNRMLIKSIYQNCPLLRYLKLLIHNDIISELEMLLTNCQYLNGLVIIILENGFDWNNLFKILIRSSPTSLFKFKFSSYGLKLESLKLLLDSWKGRHPMLLQIIPYCNFTIMLPQKLHHQLQIGCLIKDYEANGTIEKYDVDWYGQDFEDFKWVQGESITYFN
ncbi:hypothetical protein GLOIN_2v1780470 [Rhizophagus irregularis DAOM 181602=DAOM 197198]|uniref:F-box domain-containing protein n=3 Tax=Rhizophagus irregularis TaxID=588596 RepID=U9SFG0_RHIID|nr:hypothetical protein GLOIN_2v1780470 [Rhizophagus irregularis DAOM 181602=DAOM 197198]EXX67429.1 hypothetical protein RirG_114460 [Rhizophagus irregularis DAOM 197198w]POG66539.1 hypothetical protein GLOIN_2v1780470 [Rhizophagus irregularis DAOM 181602=DAOM 197198]GBC15802.1 hypothetical protein GLOIN_2v1780470 [Rhizophagus irregularis DAOM 181602=DAOM 197198]CAG8687972.1 23065_t:CDS:1 [Rhizophagus irregularis]|eukprot:XP_025173405.1 hypothetical protein GLOIN_2v1780470 [Rhizophagus irregularis DAOM 181602=DAOM 197198]